MRKIKNKVIKPVFQKKYTLQIKEIVCSKDDAKTVTEIAGFIRPTSRVNNAKDHQRQLDVMANKLISALRYRGVVFEIKAANKLVAANSWKTFNTNMGLEGGKDEQEGVR